MCERNMSKVMILQSIILTWIFVIISVCQGKAVDQVQVMEQQKLMTNATEVSTSGNLKRMSLSEKLTLFRRQYAYPDPTLVSPRTSPSEEIPSKFVTSIVQNDTCRYQGKIYTTGETFHEDCKHICECQEDRTVDCRVFECQEPSYNSDFACMEWEDDTEHVATPPKCCEFKRKCATYFPKDCYRKGQKISHTYPFPSEMVGCDQRCVCFDGNMVCDGICPELPEYHPFNFSCPSARVTVSKSSISCCREWVCGNSTVSHSSISKPEAIGDTDQQEFIHQYTLIILSISTCLLFIIFVGLFILIILRRKKAKSDSKINSLFASNRRLDRIDREVSNERIPVIPLRDFDNRAKDEWEFPRNQLCKLEHLGEGCFGQVHKYTATHLKSQPLSIVAVKTINDAASSEEKKDFLKELEILKTLGPHPNVVGLLGCCTEKDPILVILEFMNGGKLQSVLRASRADQSSTNLGGSLVPNDLIVFALQVAKGMAFLSDLTILHRDLATRNVLVTDGKICKVADFGFARDVAINNVYEKKSNGKLPIRWMAPESLFDNIFTTKSDVWSFGILLWEIVTLGSTPYPGIAASEVIKKVKDGYRLEKPEHCRQEAFDIMQCCWNLDPTERPAFKELVEILDSLISTEADYIIIDTMPDVDYYYHKIEDDSTEKL